MSTALRTSGAVNADNTGRVLYTDYQAPVYASAITITPLVVAKKTVVNLSLTGAITINIAVGSTTTPPYLDDEIVIYVVSDGTTRTITWGTGVNASAATLAVTTGKYGIVTLKFNGTAWIGSGIISA